MKTVISHVKIEELKTRNSFDKEKRAKIKIGLLNKRKNKKKLEIQINSRNNDKNSILPPIKQQITAPNKNEIFSLLKYNRNKLVNENNPKFSRNNNKIEIQERKKVTKTMNNVPKDLICDNDEDNAEFEEIIDYLNHLDFEKYKKDQEIQEALQLLKSKMEKDKQEEEVKEDNKDEIINNNAENKEDEDHIDKIIEKIEKENKEKKLKAEIYDNLKELTKSKEENEALKFHIAEKISKYDPLLSVVHSYNSIKMLFARAGLGQNMDYDAIEEKINQEKQLRQSQRESLKKNEYIPNLLPYLHSTPLLK